jgi:hypothetical protein
MRLFRLVKLSAIMKNDTTSKERKDTSDNSCRGISKANHLAHAVGEGMTDWELPQNSSLELIRYSRKSVNDRRVILDALLSFPGRNARRDGRLVEAAQ